MTLVIWGGAYNIENFRAGFEAVPFRYREAAQALGFGRVAAFLNVSLPIGGRISLPSSINTYISIVKNSALFYAIGYNELTTTAHEHQRADVADGRGLHHVAVVYLAIVWAMSIGLRFLENHLALPEKADARAFPVLGRPDPALHHPRRV